MEILRRDLQAFARACERLLAVGLDPELSPDEKQFMLYYAGELVNTFGQSRQGHTDHSQLHLPMVMQPTPPSERSA